MSGIGQTWSQPNVAPAISGYAGPVIVVGGGYDSCEDMNSSIPWCSSPKGAAVYVIDANSGAVLKSFSTVRSVAADVALVSITSPGVADHAYAVDTGGNVYRIDFGATVANWTMTRVAYTNGSGRKFLYAPALLPATGGKVYLALGTGDREHPLYTQYPYLGVTNRFYVFKDDLGSTTARNLDDPALMRDFTANTTCATAGLLPAATELGWYMNLNQYGAGEQVVTSAVIIGGMVAFSTNRPIPPAAGTCSTTLGEARGYFFSLFNASGSIGVPGACGGSRSAVFAGGGLPPSPAIGRVPVNGKVRTVVIGASQRAGGANSPIGAQEVKPPITPTRKTIYWKSSGQN